MKNLSDVLCILNNIPFINRGGCGISALALYRWLKKNRVKVSHSPFVVLCEDEYELMHNNAACENGDVDEIIISHVVIEFHGGLYDSEGRNGDMIRSMPFRQDYQLNEGELLAIINTNAWNSLFDRSAWVDYIADNLDIDLSDIEIF